jgi:hypothetical protein
MTIVLASVARFMIRLTITVVWALVLSKLIRTAWDLAKRLVRWNRTRVATANS